MKSPERSNLNADGVAAASWSAEAEQVRLSEERFQRMANSIAQLAWIAGPDGSVCWYNQRFYDYTGTTFETMQGWGWVPLIPPSALDAVMDVWRRAIAEGREVELEFPIRGADGQFRRFLTRAVPLHDAAGKVVQWFGTNTDVDALKQVEEALRESDERFRNLLQSVPTVAIQGYSVDGTVQYWNRASETFYGYTQAEAIGGNLLELIIPPEMRGEVRGALAHVAAGGEIPHGELSLMRKDGSRIAVYSSHAVVRRAGRPPELFCIDVDLTERKRAEEALRASSQELRTLTEALPQIVWVARPDGWHTYFNGRWMDYTGRTLEESLGHGWLPAFHPDDQARATARWQQALESGEPYDIEYRLRRADGIYRWMLGRALPLRDASGAIVKWFGTCTDIEDFKRAAQQRLRAQRLESIGTLAGGIAHDLNNLLSPITIGTDLLRLLDPHPDAVPILDNMARAAQRCADLVKQVLAFTRGVSGVPVPLQVAQLVREVESIIAQTFPRNIAVLTQCDSDLWRIRADATQINQVLLNLCVNARDAMPGGGTLHVRARNQVVESAQPAIDRMCHPGRYVVLEVEDSGSGMAPQVLDRIFEPFFTTKEVGKGTGLGLATVLGIVRSHRGYVNVASEVGRGSLFKVYLPAWQDDDATVAQTGRQAMLPRGAGEVVLVVDDEPDVLAITRTTLTSFGYQVVTAVDGADALKQFSLCHPQVQLVITDMMMPVMDGAVLIDALRRMAPELPVVAASGMNLAADAERAAKAGARHFVAKPYSADRLLEVVRTALRAGGVGPCDAAPS